MASTDAKTVLITGTSTGFGFLAAKTFQEKGWNVIATMRSPKKDNELASLDNVLVTRLDVTDKASVKSAVEQGIERFGAIDVLVNNAGVGAYGYLEEADEAEIQSHFDTNLFGIINTIQEITPHMRDRGSGVIINVTSLSGLMGLHLNSLYNASKFAVQGLSEGLAYDLSTFGIRVKVVAPGAFDTGFTESRVFTRGNAKSDLQPYHDQYEVFSAKLREVLYNSGGTVANPQDVADKIYECATMETPLTNPVGRDAVGLLKLKSVKSEAEFFERLKNQIMPDYDKIK